VSSKELGGQISHLACHPRRGIDEQTPEVPWGSSHLEARIALLRLPAWRLWVYRQAMRDFDPDALDAKVEAERARLVRALRSLADRVETVG